MNRQTHIFGRRLVDYFLIAVIVALVVTIIRFIDQEGPYSVVGHPKILDGDSLEFQNVRVRLAGIDAPEGRQLCKRQGKDWPCGEVSAVKLRERVGRNKVACRGSRYDQHERLLGKCEIGHLSLNAWMVLNGWAVSYSEYPAEEKAARQAKRGLWAGEFERPHLWRQQHMN